MTIPDSVTSIGTYAFSSCTALQSVTIPDSVTRFFEGVFFKCTALQSVIIPDSVTSIGDSAFQGCRALQNVTIGNKVTSIANNAFQDCPSIEILVLKSFMFNGIENIRIYFTSSITLSLTKLVLVQVLYQLVIAHFNLAMHCSQ